MQVSLSCLPALVLSVWLPLLPKKVTDQKRSWGSFFWKSPFPFPDKAFSELFIWKLPFRFLDNNHHIYIYIYIFFSYRKHVCWNDFFESYCYRFWKMILESCTSIWATEPKSQIINMRKKWGFHQFQKERRKVRKTAFLCTFCARSTDLHTFWHSFWTWWKPHFLRR